MNIRAIRLPFAILAVALLVTVLSFLLIESRSVSDDYYLSHAARVRAIESSRNDFAAVLQGARDSYAKGLAFPSSLAVAVARVEDNSDTLGNLDDLPRIDPELAATLADYSASALAFITSSRAFADHQNTLAGRLAAFQRQSPELVKYLRDQGLNAQAQRTFSLTIDVMEFATGKGIERAAPLESRIDELRNDASIVPETVNALGGFAGLAGDVLAAHEASSTALERLANSSAPEDLSLLAGALVTSNTLTVSRAERATLLLAVCAVVLLLAAAFAVWRLQASYQDLNAINAELEERVLERTGQLSKAYDDLKESQVQLIHAEKMSSLGEMVAGISHEINTPLWYLMNNASVIQERLDTVNELCEVNESMLEAVRSRQSVNETVSRGLRELNQLMQDGIRDDVVEAKSLVQDSIDGLDDLTKLAQGLKDFSRLDRAAEGEFNVNEGLERTLLIAKNRIKHKATVQRHFGDVPDIVCSPSQINQVFLNLLTNAADAIDGMGEIVIHTSAQGEHVEISIADTGCGIPAETLARIRDPFFTTKDVGHGTGLGLSIVDRIVTQHGGELRFDSEPGKGTTVTVTLPIGSSMRDSVAAATATDDRSEPDVDAALLAGRDPAAAASDVARSP